MNTCSALVRIIAGCWRTVRNPSGSFGKGWPMESVIGKKERGAIDVVVHPPRARQKIPKTTDKQGSL
ncbi:hypothetical protein BN2364_1187 [Alloalcanivorax xenomutans]|nr:hypothetical protein BN2364_1187 [Alloalcanivorax xenomutans]